MQSILNVVLCLFLTTMMISYSNSTSTKHKGMNKHSPHLSPKFSGSIKRDSKQVILRPALFAVDKDAPRRPGLICDYRLHPLGNDSLDDIPFEVKVADKQTGEGFMSLKPGADLRSCGTRTSYTFQVTAYDCGLGINAKGKNIRQRKSHRSRITVVVEDVNLNRPYFPVLNYSLEVEGQIDIGQPLVSLEALDPDCSSPYNKICDYTVIKAEADVFNVSEDGILLSRKLTKAFHKPKIYNVSVIAHDCGSKKSEPATVLITIKPHCVAKWTGFESRVEFISTLSKSVPIVENPQILTCIPNNSIQQIDMAVSLDVSDVLALTGCDRDTYSTADSRRKCSREDKQLLELLPSYVEYDNLISQYSADTNHLNSLPILKRVVAHNGGRVYEFNGFDQALDVLENGVSSALGALELTSTFAVSFRMFLDVNRDTDEKQVILSKADSRGLNRQHLSVYVRHCHVMLLLRNENGRKGELSPAEWHWKLSKNEDCDNRWYRILINIDFPNVTLYLDGAPKVPFLIADDYPLHASPYSAKWTVGAAWAGRDSNYVQHFAGKLSDLVVHVGFVEEPEVLQCVDRCREGLHLWPREELSSDAGITQDFEPEFILHLSSNGSDTTQIASALSKIVYFNNRKFPATGRRRINVKTTLTCTTNSTRCPVFDDVKMYVMVVSPPDPKITLTGGGHIARSAIDIATNSANVRLFDDISCLTKVDEADRTSDFAEGSVDSCVIKEQCDVDGMAGRFAVHPKRLLAQHGLSMETRPNGVVLRGIQSLAVYEKVLRSVTYHNPSAEDFDERIFTLTCSELNGRFHSNEYELVMTILRPGVSIATAKVSEVVEETVEPPQADAPYPAALVASSYFGSVDLKQMPENGFKKLTADHSFGRSFDIATPAIVIGLCIGLMALLVVAVAVHARSRSGAEEVSYFDEGHMEETIEKVMNEEDLDWDDSAMTITVNPLEENHVADADESGDEFSEIEDDVMLDQSTRKGVKWVTKSDDVGCSLREDVRLWDEDPNSKY